MPYIGNPIYQSAFVTDTFSGNGTTTAFTMAVAPAGTTNVLVVVSGVVQDPSTYGVVGNTITFSQAPPTGTNNISCRYLGVPVTGVTTTAYRTVTEFTATASQTTFTPPSYNVGFINIYRNGVRLGSADYTATNGTTVVLATGATAGDLVTIESFLISSVSNAIPNAAGAVTSSNIQSGVALTNPNALGKLGVNTASPTAYFQITQADASITARFQNTATGGQSWDLLSTSTGNSDVAGGKFGIRDPAVSGPTGYRFIIDTSGNWKMGSTTGVIQNTNGRPMLNQTGGVLQVVQAIVTGTITTTSTSLVAISGFTATITPASTSSKILVMVRANNLSQNTQNIMTLSLLRNGSTISATGNTSGGLSTTFVSFGSGGGGREGGNDNRMTDAASIDYLDSPASASPVTYSISWYTTGGTGYLNQWALNNDKGAVSTITLMEIAG